MYAKTFNLENKEIRELGLPVLHIPVHWKPLHNKPCACFSCRPPIGRQERSTRPYLITDGRMSSDQAKKASAAGLEVWRYDSRIYRMVNLRGESS